MNKVRIATRVLIATALSLLSGVKAVSKEKHATTIIVTQASARPAQSTGDFKVTLLGTATPAPRPDRFGPSTLVEAGPEKLLFDCGRAFTTRLWQLKIPLGTVKLFITHMHDDHTVGIPDLWLTGWFSSPYGGRKDPSEFGGQRVLRK